MTAGYQDLRRAVSELIAAETHYRKRFEAWGHDHIQTGRAWDRMRKASDRARGVLLESEPPSMNFELKKGVPAMATFPGFTNFRGATEHTDDKMTLGSAIVLALARSIPSDGIGCMEPHNPLLLKSARVEAYRIINREATAALEEFEVRGGQPEPAEPLEYTASILERSLAVIMWQEVASNQPLAKWEDQPQSSRDKFILAARKSLKHIDVVNFNESAARASGARDER